MALFRRRRREGEETRGRSVVVTEHLEVDDPDLDPDAYEDHDAPEPADPTDAPGEEQAAGEEVPDRATTGPLDRSETSDDLGNRFDLGALWLGAVEGLELRIEIEESDGSVREVRAEKDGSAMQVQVFAAPRTSGIWGDIRAEIAEAVTAQGGQADEQPGPFGTELLTRLPAAGADGRVVFAPMRFIGGDGPRWFLRAVLTGAAAGDAEAAEPFLEVLRTSVVLRGEEAMPPREMLPLTLPRQLIAPPEQPGAPEPGQPALSDLNPFERGPEITEIR